MPITGNDLTFEDNKKLTQSATGLTPDLYCDTHTYSEAYMTNKAKKSPTVGYCTSFITFKIAC